MMPREADFITKQESNTIDNGETFKASSTTTTASWSRFKDPRIVRVSKAFGGKDRHSKVCTVRGLRDRRVRLSVLTAIQLYDLQERLGLNQPSKVVDWLLDAAKHEIDELPPLQIPQGAFTQGLNPIHDFVASQSDKQSPKINADFSWNDPLKLQPGSSATKDDISEETADRNEADHQSWTRNEEQRQLNIEDQSDYVSTSDFLSRQNNPSSFSSLLSSTPYNSLVRWDPSNLSLSRPPISLGLTEDLHNFNLVQLPSSTSSVQPHQFLVYQPGINTHGYFPCQISPTNAPFDLKHPYFHTSDLNSSTQTVRPFQFSMTADLLPSQSDEQNKHDERHSS